MKGLLFCHSLMVASLLLLLTGCGKPDPHPTTSDPGTTPTTPSGPYFRAELPDERVSNADSDVAIWAVDTNIEDWKATSSESWCKPTVTAKELRLDIEEYKIRNAYGYDWEYAQPRTCTVDVTAGTVFSKSIRIVQQTYTIITFPQQSLSANYDWIQDGPTGMIILLSSDGDTREVMISSNAWLWVPETTALWLKAEYVDGATLKLTSSARAQSETSARSAQVKVYDKNNELVYSTFTVQDAPANVEGQDFGYGDHTGWD